MCGALSGGDALSVALPTNRESHGNADNHDQKPQTKRSPHLLTAGKVYRAPPSQGEIASEQRH
jgi:hypothetical protein